MRAFLKLLSRLVLVVLVLSPVAVAGLVYLAVDSSPLVTGTAALGPEKIDRARRILSENDPRRLRDGEVKTVVIEQDEIDLVVAHLMDRIGSGAAQTEIAAGTLVLAASVRLPENPVGRYLNVSLGVGETGTLPRFRHLRVGRIAVPRPLANLALDKALDAWHAETGASANEVIREVTLRDERLRVTYRWRSDLTEIARAKLVSPEDRRRLEVYQERLTEVAAKERGKVSLTRLVEPVFDLARRRSAENDPVAENRSAILVLAAYLVGKSFESLVPEAAGWPRPARLGVTVHRRDDLPKHFMISAALAATGGRGVSEAIGLFKEVDDSRGGSGFSFPDLVADHAGTRFGERATDSIETAVRLQIGASRPLAETHLVPDVSGFEENMTEAEFERRYGGVGGERYESVVRDIRKRIGASPLYR